MYVYPKFDAIDGYDLGFVRLGGPGLGNLLMFYAQAISYAHDNNVKLIHPTWPSLKLGPYIRREKDKRFYGDLFKSNGDEITGLKKFWLLLFSRKNVIMFDRYYGSMGDAGLLGREKATVIRNHLMKHNAHPEYIRDIHDTIAIHVRLGDFFRVDEATLKNKAENSSTPVYWYAKTLTKIRSALGRNIKACVFSDGTDEELALLLKLDNCERVFCGNALNDILTIATAPVLLASGSTFSNWARYLGNMSAIFFPGQMQERFGSDFEIELDNDEDFSEEVIQKLRLKFDSLT